MIANEGFFPEFNQRCSAPAFTVRPGPSLLLKTSPVPLPRRCTPGFNTPVHADILSVSFNILLSPEPDSGRHVQAVYCILNIVINLNKKNGSLAKSNGNTNQQSIVNAEIGPGAKKISESTGSINRSIVAAQQSCQDPGLISHTSAAPPAISPGLFRVPRAERC